MGAFNMTLPGYPTEYQSGAKRLDGGGRPNPIILPMALDGLNHVLEWEPAKTAAALLPLTERIRRRCVDELGLWAPTLHGPHFVGIGPGVLDGRDDPRHVAQWCQDAARFLKKHQIYVTARLKVLRVAPHLYTRVSDV